MVALDGILTQIYEHGGPGVCLGDGQTAAKGATSQGGRGDPLLRRILVQLEAYAIKRVAAGAHLPTS